MACARAILSCTLHAFDWRVIRAWPGALLCCCDLAAGVAGAGELRLRKRHLPAWPASYLDTAHLQHGVQARQTACVAFIVTTTIAMQDLQNKAMAPANRRLSAACSQQRDQQQQQLALPAGLVAGAGAMLAHPLVAEAGVTPSLKNLLFSVVAGGFVLSAIAIAVTGGQSLAAGPIAEAWSSAFEAVLHGTQQHRNQSPLSLMPLAGVLYMRYPQVHILCGCLSIHLAALHDHVALALSPLFRSSHTDTFLSALHSLPTVSNFE